VDRDLAQDILKRIVALDHPIGQIMEIVKVLDDQSKKAELKQCCGTLLAAQLELIERITAAYPELRDIDPAASDT
jgi:hypothetical protein